MEVIQAGQHFDPGRLRAPEGYAVAAVRCCRTVAPGV
jgi:hypothetical protein